MRWLSWEVRISPALRLTVDAKISGPPFRPTGLGTQVVLACASIKSIKFSNITTFGTITSALDGTYGRSADLADEGNAATMDSEILTTAEAAKLLGTSIRTAQLLIEGGSIPSWKTPGGHRRVYRSDVVAIISGKSIGRHSAASARIVVVAGPQRREAIERAVAAVPECSVVSFTDMHSALLAIGSSPPAAIVIDVADNEPAPAALVASLAQAPSLGATRLFAVGDGLDESLRRAASPITDLDQLTAAIRTLLSDPEPQEPTWETGTPFPLAANERQRLIALERSGLVDTPPEETFDHLTWLAAHTLDTPIALLTLVTPDRQWFKSRVGVDLPETPRSWAFCNHTILQTGVFQVADLAHDPRFAENPAVAGPLGFRFYAGAPMKDPEGFPLGSLCVIDYKPRRLEQEHQHCLLALAALASNEVKLRAVDRRLRQLAGAPAATRHMAK